MKLIAPALALMAAVIAHAATPAAGVNDTVVRASGFPATLAEFGFFTGGAEMRPAPGVTPYRLNTPLWSDGSTKERFLYLPAGTKAGANGEGLLVLPLGAALIKTFKFDGRLIETRVLLHRAEGWVALPYRWNEEQTEARLVLAGGRVDLTTPQGVAISYAIPNKNQCKECHALAGVVTPIGPKARNLSEQWLAGMFKAGRLDAVPQVAARLPVWEDRAAAPAGAVARGYLDANCAHCHNPQGSASNSGLDLRWEQSDPASYGVNKRPVAAGQGAGTLEYSIVPGHPERSIIVHRMSSTEPGVAMPELGRSSTDSDGVAAVTAWIAGMGSTAH